MEIVYTPNSQGLMGQQSLMSIVPTFLFRMRLRAMKLASRIQEHVSNQLEKLFFHQWDIVWWASFLPISTGCGGTMGSNIYQANALHTNPKNENKNTATKRKVSIYPTKNISRSKNFYFFILVSLPLKKRDIQQSPAHWSGVPKPSWW